MNDYTIAEKLEWLESELCDRRRNYPDMIKKNQITQENGKEEDRYHRSHGGGLSASWEEELKLNQEKGSQNA